MLDSTERTVSHKPPEFTGFWSSSQLGCWRQMYLIAKGIEGDWYDSPVLKEGRLHEDDLIAQMAVKGVVVTDRFEELKHPILPLKGHPDGRFTVTQDMNLGIPEGRYILEAKSMDRSFYYKAVKDFKTNFPHLYQQLQSYSLMSEGHESVFVPIKNRATGEIYEYVFEPDPDTWDEIEKGMANLQVAIHTPGFDYKTLVCATPDSIKAKYCPYRDRELCESQTNIPEVTEQELVFAIQQYEEGKTVESHGSKLKADARKIAVAYITNHNLVTMTVAGKLVSIIPSSRRVCDFDKLRDLDSKIYDQVVDDSESDRFTIK